MIKIYYLKKTAQTKRERERMRIFKKALLRILSNTQTHSLKTKVNKRREDKLITAYVYF